MLLLTIGEDDKIRIEKKIIFFLLVYADKRLSLPTENGKTIERGKKTAEMSDDD